jgi:hypothetical protein
MPEFRLANKAAAFAVSPIPPVNLYVTIGKSRTTKK